MVKKIFNLLGLFTGIILYLQLMSCAHYSVNAHYKGPKVLPREIIEEFSYKKSTPLYEEKIIEVNPEYTIKQIKFTPSYNILPTEHSILIDYYDISGTQKTPIIIVIPILGGSNTISKSFASYFSSKGYASAIVHRQEKYTKLEDIDTIDITLRQMVFDLKQAIDWIETQEDLDNEKIGVFGVSMGAIKGSLLSALDDRIGASVFALTAGDIPYLLTYSNEKGIQKRKNEIMKENKLTRKEFYNELKKKINCDPINYAEYIDAKAVLMILALFDRIVPYRKGKELREKIGKPETIYLFSGHLTALPFIYYIKSESFQFFQKRFL